MNQDYGVICGNYIGENNKMYCQECEEKYLGNKKDLTNNYICAII